MIDSTDPKERGDDPQATAAEPRGTTAVVGGATLGPAMAPAESGRRADSLFTPAVTGGSEGFANTAGGTLLAPDVASDEDDPNSGT
ncbi:MAG: hypothetical protein H0U10_00740 [Chloroflexia bacterium]|nr:hypothetical protein [Chloroflexia bacterium]